jgi:hypothetical protein
MYMGSEEGMKERNKERKRKEEIAFIYIAELEWN